PEYRRAARPVESPVRDRATNPVARRCARAHVAERPLKCVERVDGGVARLRLLGGESLEPFASVRVERVDEVMLGESERELASGVFALGELERVAGLLERGGW